MNSTKFYFIQAVLNGAQKRSVNFGDAFGIGEDEFINNIKEHIDCFDSVFEQSELKMSEVFNFASNSADCFWLDAFKSPNGERNYPPIDSFERQIRELIKLRQTFVGFGHIEDGEDQMFCIYAYTEEQARQSFERAMKESDEYINRNRSDLDIYIVEITTLSQLKDASWLAS